VQRILWSIALQHEGLTSSGGYTLTIIKNVLCAKISSKMGEMTWY